MRELTRILTLTPRRTAQLRRLGLLHGDSGYTFRDLLALRAAGALLDAGASVRQIREALDGAARRATRACSSRWPRCDWSSEGGRLLAQSDRREVRSAHRPDGAGARHAEPRGGRRRDAGDRPRAPAGAARGAGRDVVRARQRVGRRSRAVGRRRRRLRARGRDRSRPTRRPGTTWACSCTAWDATTRRAARTRRRSGQDDSAARPSYNLGSLAEDLRRPRGGRRAATATRSSSRPTTPTPTSTWPARSRAPAGPKSAVVHWQRYLELDAGSPWARIARAHLEVLRAARRSEDVRRTRARSVLVPVGGGGREHALAWKLAQSPLLEHMWSPRPATRASRATPAARSRRRRTPRGLAGFAARPRRRPRGGRARSAARRRSRRPPPRGRARGLRARARPRRHSRAPRPSPRT